MNEQCSLSFRDLSYFTQLLQHQSLEGFKIVFQFVIDQLTLFDVLAILQIIGQDDEIGVQS